MFKVSSRQSLLESCKCAKLFEEADKYNGCEEEGRRLCFEYIWLSCLPQSFGTC
ncbi:hypothetical protein Goklo_024119 [Gossypium klotzschianum]|uniref:Uncharacterized protein n=1 Tax=Gossypium klotzschianum TaxID=34286 RepID=A0A7J8W9K7_9ROSI|nr:hypothetical protein [Gossypium klotzschianum]